MCNKVKKNTAKKSENIQDGGKQDNRQDDPSQGDNGKLNEEKASRGMTINGTKSYAKGIALVFSLIFRRNCINLANQLIQGVIIKLLMPHSSIL